MRHGLLKILNSIANDIGNQVLINRFMGLVSELDSEDEKAEYVLKFSSVLEEGNPLIAMQYAYMVYQYDRLSVEALQAVVRCLKQLGRYAKAEVLNNELIKIQELKNRAPTFASREGSRTFTTGLSKMNVDGVEFMGAKEPPTAPKPTLKIDPPRPANLDPLLATMLPKVPPKAAQKTKLPHAASVEAVQPKAQPAWSGPDLGVVLELFDFYWKHGLLDQAADLLAGVKSEAQNMPWWKARFAAMQQLNAKKVIAPMVVEQKVQPEPEVEEPTLSEGLPYTIKELIDEKQFRKALFALSKEAANLDSPELASVYYACYIDLCKKLGLSALAWSPHEGIETLRIKLQQRPQANLKGAAIRQSKKKPKAS